jgi:AbrB family looped-hinge helix DNA binding protein
MERLYTFVAKVQKLRRIAIPKPIWEALKIKEGEKVMVNISKYEELEFR